MCTRKRAAVREYQTRKLSLVGATQPLHSEASQSPINAILSRTSFPYLYMAGRLSLSCQIPSVSSEELAILCLIRCELSRLCCHGHSLLLSSCLCRIKRKENASCSACGHPQQDLTHLLLDCPASEPLRRAIFGITSLLLPFLTSGPDLGAWPDSVEFLHAPHPSEGVG